MSGNLESHIGLWRGHVLKQRAITPADADEMEGHLRDQVDDLVTAGLSDDEAFLVAVKRMGALDDISREFAREHSERLWKQLVLAGPEAEAAVGPARHLGAALAFAVAAAVCARAAVWVTDGEVLARNLWVLTVPFIAGYLGWTRRLAWGAASAALVTFSAVALVMNLFPWRADADSTTEILAVTHAPVVLWLVVGVAYAGGDWRSHARRMDFVRFTGEWVVYMALLALGGGVVTALTLAVFVALDVGHAGEVAGWIIPMGAAGATVVAVWLVEAKQAVVENIAPVLTKVFTPITIVMLAAVLAALATRHTFVGLDRGLLIVVDLILALVLGLVLYAISARDRLAPPSLFDRLQLVLLLLALATDAVLLVTMVARIADTGVTANKVAALGMNLVLLVNLVWSTRLLARFNRGAIAFAALERWQTGYLPVYGVWAAAVVGVLPLLFDFA